MRDGGAFKADGRSNYEVQQRLESKENEGQVTDFAERTNSVWYRVQTCTR